MQHACSHCGYALQFFEFFLATRANQRHYRTFGDVQQMLTVMKVTRKGLPWFNQLCQVSYHLYLLLHKQWKPRTKRSSVEADVPMSLAPRRKLSYTGLCLSSAPSLPQQAADVALQRLDEPSNSPCVVWYDNSYRKHWLPTPCGANAALNCFVFAILPLRRELDVFPGYPQLGSLFFKIGDIATSVVQRHNTLLANLDNALNASLTLRDVRCPLDLNRKGVKRLQWKLLLLSECLFFSCLFFFGVLFAMLARTPVACRQ